tara:strand:- start:190 stop:330 length:141 start_codon:yes stop_codon:yes gene_type:complete
MEILRSYILKSTDKKANASGIGQRLQIDRTEEEAHSSNSSHTIVNK